MDKPNKLIGKSYFYDSETANGAQFGEITWYSDCFVIYIDKMGTTYQIRETDEVYDNRKGFHQLSILYQRSAEILHDSLNGNFKFFGFSDTILAVIPHEKNDPISTELIATTAISLFLELTKMYLPVKIFISRGDFGFHIFKGLIDQHAGVVCPVYGSSLLNAYECDKRLKDLKVKCVGVFIHKSAINDFEIIGIIKNITEDQVIGLIDVQHYLGSDEFNNFVDEMRDHTKIQTLEELQEKIFDRSCGCGEAIYQIISLMPDERTDESLDILKKSNERIIKNQEFIAPYYSNLIDAIEKRELINKPNS